jgi:hypothetical protein
VSIPSDTTSSTLFPHWGQDNSPRRKWTSAAIAPRFSARSGAPRSGRPTDRRLGPPPVSSGELSSPYLVTCPLILMVALQKEESTAKSDSAQCRGSSLLLVPLRPNLAVQCHLLETWPVPIPSKPATGPVFPMGERSTSASHSSPDRRAVRRSTSRSCRGAPQGALLPV